MYQNRHSAPPSRSADSASLRSSDQESAALRLPYSSSSSFSHDTCSPVVSQGSASSARAKKYPAWARLTPSASPFSTSFSLASSRMVSSITKRGSPSAPSSSRSRLSSTSEEALSNTSAGSFPRASHTAFMAFSVAPPENTPSLPKSTFSPSSSKP